MDELMMIALKNNLSTVYTCLWSNVENFIRSLHDLFFVLYDNDRVSNIS